MFFSTEVLATLTTDVGKILTSLHKVQPSGLINLLTGIRIAHVCLFFLSFIQSNQDVFDIILLSLRHLLL